MAIKQQCKKARPKLKAVDLRKLETIIAQYIDEHRVTGPENVHDDDDVIVNAYGLMTRLFNVVGYYAYPDDETEDED